MKLIRELTESVNYLTEEKDGKKNLYIEGPFLVAEAVNKNKRMYKEETMRNEVNRYTEEYITKNRAFGDRKSTRLNSSHVRTSRMPSSA